MTQASDMVVTLCTDLGLRPFDNTISMQMNTSEKEF